MRTSRKQVEQLLIALNATHNTAYALAMHQELGNRADYYYTYSLTLNNSRIASGTLRSIYEYAMKLL